MTTETPAIEATPRGVSFLPSPATSDDRRLSPKAVPTKRSLAHSVAWTAASKWSGQLLTSGITLLVARILTPADYGLVGMALLFLGFVRFLSDFGIGGAVVARGEYDSDRLAALNTCAVLFGLCGCIVTIAAASSLGRFFKQPDLPFVIVVTSSTFCISGFRVLPTSVLQRDLRFKLLAGIDLTQSILASSVTLLLALIGARYWALVLGNIVALAIATVITIIASPQRFGRPVLSKLRPAASMSRDLTISNICWYIYSNSDFLVVGKVLGQAALGLYNIGWTLAMPIVERVTTIVGGVTPAYLSAVRDNPTELKRYLGRISGAIALLTFPVSVGLALVADDFCTVVLGPKWAGAVAALRLLALYAGVRSLTPIIPQILNVVGEHRFVARNAGIAAIVMPAAFWFGSRWGPSGVALVWVIVFPLITVPLFMRVFGVLKMTATEYLGSIRLPLISSVIMAAGIFLFRFLAAGTIPVVRLGLTVAIGASLYAGALYFVFGATPATLLALRRTRLSM